MKAKILLLCGTALSMVVCQPAMAQPAPSSDAKAQTLGDVIVTARRVEERAQDVPISMKVFDQKALTDRNISEAQDLVNYTPSLSVNARFGSENNTFSLRGFAQEIGTAPSVGVYFADVVAPRGFAQGVPAGDGAGPGSFFDLQNVQVLNGPQGTLFGRNTTGGAVLLVPNKPTDRFEGSIEGTVGDYGLRRVQAIVNAPLSDKLRIRLGVDNQKRDGYLINDSGKGPRDLIDSDYIALRASMVADITPDLENYTIASFSNSKNNGSVQPISACYPNVSPQVALFMSQACGNLAVRQASGFYHTFSDMPDPVSKLRQWQVINTTTWRASDSLTVKNIISYARLQNVFKTALYGNKFFIPTGPAFLGDVPLTYINVRTTPGGYMADQSTFTEELQFQGNALDGKLDWQAGGFYEDSKPQSFVGSQPPILISCTNPDTLQCIDLTAISPPFQPQGAVTSNLAKNSFNSKAVYAQASYKLTEQFKLTGGIRYTWDEMKADGRLSRWIFPASFAPLTFAPTWSPVRSCSLPAATLPNCDVFLSKTSSAPTWLIGLDYTPNDDVLLFAKYSRGYRTGGVKTDAPIQYATFNPEEVDTFEVGAKTSFEGPVRGIFNTSAFYNDFSDQQIQYGEKQNYCRYTGTLQFDGGGNPICLPFFPIAPTAGPINVGKSRIWGIEVESQIRPIERLVLNASYAYLNTRVEKVKAVTLPTDSPFVLDGELRAGDSLPYSPEHKLTLGATYTLPLDESAGELSVGINYTYTSDQIASYGARQPAVLNYFGKDLGVLDSRNLIDLYVNWRKVAGGPFDLGLFVTNLTDEEYYVSATPYLQDLGFAASSVGQPRMFGVRAKYNFGN